MECDSLKYHINVNDFIQEEEGVGVGGWVVVVVEPGSVSFYSSHHRSSLWILLYELTRCVFKNQTRITFISFISALMVQ